MSNERVVLTREQADGMMSPGEYVHTFMQEGGVLLGCGVAREKILAHADDGRVELAGEYATKMGHGICVLAAGERPMFVETKEPDET